MPPESPIPAYLVSVSPDWIDYNGNMGEAYYVLTFGQATDAFYDEIGLDAITRQRTGRSGYTVETHICYLRRVGAGVPLRVTTQVLDFDDKRAHIFHEMRHAEAGTLLATEELMLVHVDTAGPHAVPFPPEVVELLVGLQEAQADLKPPEQAGRVIRIDR